MYNKDKLFFGVDNWHNIAELEKFTIEESEHGFSGRLVDKYNKTINIFGMPADNIGFSYNKETTTAATQKEFNEIWAIVENKQK